jgi:hypothetical protein
MVAMISGSSGSVVIAYCGSKSGPGPISETVCTLPPGAGVSPQARAHGSTGSGWAERGAARSSQLVDGRYSIVRYWFLVCAISCLTAALRGGGLCL